MERSTRGAGRIALAAGAAALFLSFDASSARGDEPAAIGELFLESSGGERVSLQAAVPGRKLTVLALLFDHDHAHARKGAGAQALALATSLGKLERDFRERGVRFLAVDAGAGSREHAARFAAEARLEFPLLLDPWSVAAERVGDGRAGEVLLLDDAFRVLYRGAADDRFEAREGAAPDAPLPARANNDYLADAIESALAGETLDPERTEPGGALLGSGAALDHPVTFHRDVAPILWQHCVGCHRPGQVGPMAFLDVDEATGWALQIAEVVNDGRMPPWHADPRHGRFKNERRLTDTEKRTLARWAESGANAGDPKDSPPAPTFSDPEWTIGPPDLVLELPEEQAIAAEGVLAYRYIPLDPGFTEERWVQSVEVRPSARAATHHVIAYLLPAGMSPKEALRDPATVLQLSALGGYAPGSNPMVLPDGQGTRLPKGSTILFELHYTPIGKAMTDRTKVGVRFSRVPVTQEVETGAAMNFRFRIPPHKNDATFQAKSRFRADSQILTLTPHLHRRGKAFRYELERKDGTREVLLDVPAFDFNWQHTYVLTEPVAAAAGDVMHVTAVYDNSKANPFNPDPNAWVTWGDQTFEEMLIGYFDYVEARAARE